MTEQGRFKNDSFGGLPIADVPYLKKIVQAYRDNPDLSVDWFFYHALAGFYDAMWDGLNTTAGNIIYRLSDAIEKTQRDARECGSRPLGFIGRLAKAMGASSSCYSRIHQAITWRI